jgi:hypothetical protein
MAKKKKCKYKIGSIVAVPLPDGRFAFAKIFADYDFGVYSFLSKKIEPLERILAHKFAFFYSATDSAVVSGEWPIVGEEPFPDEDSSWGPPKAGGVLPQDGLGVSSPQLKHKGKARTAKIEELVGLDIDFFEQDPEMFVEMLVDRLIKGDHSTYRVQP